MVQEELQSQLQVCGQPVLCKFWALLVLPLPPVSSMPCTLPSPAEHSSVITWLSPAGPCPRQDWRKHHLAECGEGELSYKSCYSILHTGSTGTTIRFLKVALQEGFTKVNGRSLQGERLKIFHQFDKDSKLQCPAAHAGCQSRLCCIQFYADAEYSIAT